MWSATLGGFPIPAIAPVVWSLGFGSGAPTFTVELATGDADRLFLSTPPPGPHETGSSRPGYKAASVGETVLAVKGQDELSGKDYIFTVSRVVIIGRRSGSVPWTTTILLSDIRWYWKFRHIGLKRYNVPRMSGTRRLNAAGRVEIQPIVSDLTYAPYSLKDESTPWTAREIVDDVFELLGVAPRYEFTGSYVGDDRLPQNIVIDEDAPSAVARALGTLIGREMYVDLDGTVVITDRVPGAGKAIVEALGPGLENGGTMAWRDRSADRPADVMVGFTPEYEVFFPFVDSGGTVTTAHATEDDRFIENVAQVTDAELTIEGKTIAAGSYVNLDQLFAAWGSPGGSVPSLSRAMARRMFLRPHLRDRYIFSNGGLGVEPSRVWSGRIMSTLQNFRQTFRINRRWMDRALVVRPIRAAIIDPETGTRAPSTVFADYAAKPSLRRLSKQKDTGTTQATWNVAYSSSVPAPARVSMISPDEGILRFDFAVDPYDESTQIFPCRLDGQVSLTPSALFILIEQAELASTHQASVIVSMVPANQTIWKKIEQSDVAPLVPKGNGPTLEARVGPGLVTARHAWDNAKATAIERAFGIRKENLLGDEMNDGATVGPPVNDDELTAYARAVAEGIYLSSADHYDGTLTVPLDDTIRPRGEVEIVSFQLTAEGKGLTIVVAGTPPPVLDIPSRLPAGIRQVLMREVQE